MISREEYLALSDEKRAELKALMKAIRKDSGFGERTRNLAWGFVRGFKYRRIERSHKKQYLAADACVHLDAYGYGQDTEGKFFEQNMPNPVYLAKLLSKYFPEFEADFKDKWSLKPESRILAWLKDPTGAIPAPVREKKPFVRAAE